MFTRQLLVSLLFGLLCVTARAALVTYDSEAGFSAIAAPQTRYDFEQASGFPAGDYDPNLSWIGEFDGIIFDATVIAPNQTPTSGSQAMTGAGGSYTSANLDFSGSGRRITGFGFQGLDLVAGEWIRVSASFRDAGSRIFDIALAPGQTELTPVFFGAHDANDALLGLSISGLDEAGSRAWYIDDLRLVSAVPLPPALPLLLGGLLLMGSRFRRATR